MKKDILQPESGPNMEYSPQKQTLWERVRNMFRYRVHFAVVPRTKSAVTPAAMGESGFGSVNVDTPEQDPLGSPLAPPPPSKKPGKDKKTKAKKEKPQKVLKTDNSPGGFNKKAVAIFLVIIAVVSLTTGGVAAGVVYYRANYTPEARLGKAQTYFTNEKYDKAVEAYTELLSDEPEMVEAYLGIAHTYLAAEDEESAIIKLQAGFRETGDQRIADMLDTLVPPEPDVEEATEVAGPNAMQMGESAGSGEVEPPFDPVVTWNDPAFERMVRLAMDFPDSQDIRASDLKSVKTLKIIGETHAAVNDTLVVRNESDGYTVDKVRYTERGGITSLADVKNFPNLTRLTVGYNSVEVINGVETASDLELLGLYANEITDISPVAELTELKYFFAYHNHIESLEPLSGLKQLRQVGVQYNNISDLAPLSQSTELTELYISGNQVTDLAPLANMSNLRFLVANNNDISDISVVAELPALTDISFDGNPISDFSPAANVVKKPDYGNPTTDWKGTEFISIP